MFLLLVVSAIASPNFNLELNNLELFKQFTEHYKREYRTPIEALRRFTIFQNTVKYIRKRNSERKSNSSPTFGITQFADHIKSELPVRPIQPDKITSKLKGSIIDDDYRTITLPKGDNIPSMLSFCGDYVNNNIDHPKVDLCGKHFDQGSCGSCYAAATVNLGQILYVNQSFYYNNNNIKKVSKPLFAIQRFLDESTTRRCCGGNPQNILQAVPSFTLETEYPYVDFNTKPNYDGSSECIPRGVQPGTFKIELNVKKYKMFVVEGTQEEKVLQLKKILHHYGPFISALRTSADEGFSLYKSGIYSFPNTNECVLSKGGYVPDHSIVIVGYGMEDGKEYFLLRNSWSDDWGENGYMKMDSSVLCGLGFDYGTYYRPLNGVLWANSCLLDKKCKNCDSTTLICSECKTGYSLNDYGICISPNTNEYNTPQTIDVEIESEQTKDISSNEKQSCSESGCEESLFEGSFQKGGSDNLKIISIILITALALII